MCACVCVCVGVFSVVFVVAEGQQSLRPTRQVLEGECHPASQSSQSVSEHF